MHRGKDNLRQAIWRLAMAGLLAIWLAGCAFEAGQELIDQLAKSSAANEDEAKAIASQNRSLQPVLLGAEAMLEEVEVVILESEPVQVNAIFQGQLPDGCVTIERIDQGRNRDTFWVTIVTARQVETPCQAESQSFGEGVHLDTVGLPSGVYTVTATSANSVSENFSLSEEHVIPAESTPRPITTKISGVIWADFCRLSSEQTADSTAVDEAGCVSDDNDGYRPDGLLAEAEARIAGVLVNLKLGECPGGTTILTKATSVDGTYQFEDLQTGFYCVSIEAESGPNAAILAPGYWTHPTFNPDRSSANTTVSIGPDQTQTANFGWSYQLEATETREEIACNDGAAYVEDVTTPDDTLIAPGEAFTKTWRVRNNGDCTWGPGYALIFDSGDQMNGPAAVQFEQIVQPGREVDLSVPLVAPAAEGTYRGDWKIQSSSGEIFGSLGDFSFYVQIIVSQSAGASSE